MPSDENLPHGERLPQGERLRALEVAANEIIRRMTVMEDARQRLEDKLDRIERVLDQRAGAERFGTFAISVLAMLFGGVVAVAVERAFSGVSH